MRIFTLIILASISIISCNKKEVVPRGELDFLLGDWERTNNDPGVITMEHWTISNPNEYKGHGYTITKKDTTFQEYMRLIKKDSLWILEVAGPNENPTNFTLTRQTKTSFLAENPQHDFPKKITYSYFDDTLTANVSNEEMEIPFIFWRLEH